MLYAYINSAITLRRTDYRFIKTIIEENLPDAGAKMTLACVNFRLFIAQFHGLFEQTSWATIKERLY